MAKAVLSLKLNSAVVATVSVYLLLSDTNQSNWQGVLAARLVRKPVAFVSEIFLFQKSVYSLSHSQLDYSLKKGD